MKIFKEYKNLILSICSLSATLLLLIICVLGWYVTNKEAYVTGVVGSTDGVDCSVSLSYYDGEEFQTADSISLNDMEPGDVFYFMLTCKSGEGEIELEFIFDGIKSSLNKNFIIDNEKLCVENGNYNIPIYELNEDSNVVVNDKVLYSYDSLTEQFLLDKYLIQDTILFYDLGETWTTPPSLEGLTGESIDDPKYVVKVDNEVSYHYFALEFNNELSTIKVDSINGETVDTLIENSNLFLYQKLEIESMFYSIN